MAPLHPLIEGERLEMRPRAGHGMTFGRRSYPMIFDGVRFVDTYAAHTWSRCNRCRRPEKFMPYDQGLCSTCFFYKNDLPVAQFWELHNQGFPWAPYNIGKRLMRAITSPISSTFN